MTTRSLKVCTDCGHMNPPDARFCNQCGKAIASQGDAAPYTPRHLGEKILRLRSSLEGERKQVSVLFVDVRGSVALSQQVEAEVWHAIMDRFFAMLGEHVHALEGTVNQYTGDGIMALFGAPLAHEDHAARACRAALNIREDVQEWAQELRTQYDIDFAIRQGLNSGEVIVGRIGDDLRMDYTAKGQTVGLAARMEQLARPGSILLSAFTRNLVLGEFELRERGGVSVKGFAHKIQTYELAGVGRVLPAEVHDIAPLLGREQELGLLAAYRAQVLQQDHGLLVTISGDTGMGKSRLCREFVARCRAEGVPVYGVRGSSHHRAEPLAPVRELLGSYCGLSASDTPEQRETRVREVLQTFPKLPQVQIDNLLYLLGAREEGEGEELDSARRVELALALMLRLLREGALNEHAVLLLENVQWLDDEHSGAALDALVDMLAHVPLLLIMTARSDYGFRWQQRRCTRSLSLQPLGEADAQTFLAHMIGEEDSLAELRRAIVARADGNPMFMAEVVEQLVASGALERDGKGYRLRRKPEEIQLPPSVQAVVAARIDALAESSKRLLQTAAVIGRRVPLPLLREVYQAGDLDDALHDLLAQGFVEPEPASRDGTAVLFTQSLFQTVAYEALLRDVRRDLHQRIAAAMQPEQCRDANRLAQAAWHFAEAGDAEAAVHWYLHSAEQAARVDLTEAVRRLERARRLLDDARIEPAVRMQVLARYLQLAVRVDPREELLKSLQDEARTAAEQANDLPAQLMYAVARCSVALVQADPLGALQHIGAARKRLRADSPTALKLLVAVPNVHALQACGRLDEALHAADQALAWCGDDNQSGMAVLSYSPRVALTTLKAWLSVWLGRCNQAIDLVEQALSAAEQTRHCEQIAMALAAQAFILSEAGQPGLAVNKAQLAIDVAQGTKNRAVELMAQSALGRALVRDEQWPEAVAALQDALAGLRHDGFGMAEVARMQADLSLAFLLSGNARSARQAAAQAVKQARLGGVALGRLEALLAQIRAGLYSSRPLHFLKRYDAALTAAQSQLDDCQARLLQPELLLLRARWHLLRDDAEAAQACREQADGLLAEFACVRPLICRLD